MVDDQELDDAVVRFDGTTIAIHWITLLLIVAVFATAWAHAAAEGGAQAAALLAAHRSLGLLIWLLTIARLGWRWTRGSHPPLPDTVSAPQLWAARATEYALYALLAIQPLTGLAQSLFRGRPFDLIVGTIPALVTRDRGLVARFGDLHTEASWLLLGLIGLHALAALAHRFVFKDQVLQSILPWRPQADLPTNFSEATE
ncbi:MAG TPA: cytochrome b/b6 domain-containing protein [Allosphingosinicella sp.]|jgi:cytochrome b561|nr:cytochrome b/b6 domain-containing protein [Allosphingosinicella sp.]